MAEGEFKVGILQQKYVSPAINAGTDTTLTEGAYKSGFIYLNATLSANVNIIIPAVMLEAGNSWVVFNGTTGNYSLTFKGESGTGVVISQGKVAHVLFNGTNMVAFPTDASLAGGSGVLYASTADSAAIASTASETNFGLNFALRPNFFTAGRALRITASGKYSDTGTPTLQLKLKATSVTLLDLTAVTLGSGVSNKQWKMEIILVCRTVGVTGTVQASLVSALLDDDLRQAIANVATVDTTIAETLQVSAQWSASDAANTATQELLLIEALN